MSGVIWEESKYVNGVFAFMNAFGNGRLVEALLPLLYIE